MDQVKPRDIAISLAGNDSGRAYVVIKTDEVYAYLADGKTRRVSNPKKKAIKHLRLGKVGNSSLAGLDFSGMAADSLIRKQLAIFRSEADVT